MNPGGLHQPQLGGEITTGLDEITNGEVWRNPLFERSRPLNQAEIGKGKTGTGDLTEDQTMTLGQRRSSRGEENYSDRSGGMGGEQ